MVVLSDPISEEVVDVLEQILDQINANDRGAANRQLVDLGEGRPVVIADLEAGDSSVVCASEMEGVADGGWMDVSEQSDKAIQMDATTRELIGRVQNGAVGVIIARDVGSAAEGVVARWSASRRSYGFA